MKTILLAVGISMLLIAATKSQLPEIRHELSGVGIITLLNTGKATIDWNCLEEQVRSLIVAVDDNQIENFKTIIDRDHTIVKDIIKEKGMRIERRGGRESLLIPFKYRGERFVLYQGDDYRLVGLVGGRNIDFARAVGK